MGVLWAVMLSPLAILYGSLTIMILAHIVRGFPVETRIMASTLIQISKELEEAARIHGASWLASFMRILIPLVKNGFITGWVIGFSVSFSDLTLVAFLYGPESTVLPTLFFSLWRNGQLERASAAALIMAVIVLTVVIIMRRVSRTGLTAAD
jgi:iron(III) transport system permease protein